MNSLRPSVAVTATRRVALVAVFLVPWVCADAQTAASGRVFVLEAPAAMYGKWVKVVEHSTAARVRLRPTPGPGRPILGQVAYRDVNNQMVVKAFSAETELVTGGMKGDVWVCVWGRGNDTQVSLTVEAEQLQSVPLQRQQDEGRGRQADRRREEENDRQEQRDRERREREERERREREEREREQRARVDRERRERERRAEKERQQKTKQDTPAAVPPAASGSVVVTLRLRLRCDRLSKADVFGVGSHFVDEPYAVVQGQRVPRRGSWPVRRGQTVENEVHKVTLAPGQTVTVSVQVKEEDNVNLVVGDDDQLGTFRVSLTSAGGAVRTAWTAGENATDRGGGNFELTGSGGQYQAHLAVFAESVPDEGKRRRLFGR